MGNWLLVVLVMLATHRLTRLVVVDEIPLVKIPRDKAVDWLDPVAPGKRAPLGGFGRSIAYLMGCPWCTSAYTGGIVVLLTSLTASLPTPLLVWAASSSVTGLIASFEARHEQIWEAAELEKERLHAMKARQWRS